MMINPKRRKPALAIAFTALALILIPLTPSQVMADMFGFLKRYDVHLSPEVHGRITLDGEPMAGLTVYREMFYEKRRVDTTNTDSDGFFNFPQKDIKSSAPGKLFGETHVTQVITVDYKEETYLLWRTSTSRIKPSAEITKKLGSLECDLTMPEKLQHFPMAEHPSFTHDVSSICRWTDQ